MKNVTPKNGIFKDALKLIGICGVAVVDLAKFAWDNPIATAVAMGAVVILDDVDAIADNSEVVAQHITEYTAK
jgi:hypothetical protein|tara:strand:- start:749 stop:967 length:219 start_codon:yes stop_codon:yes gene_type:complete